MSNHLTLTGNITRDPELKFTASGQGRAVLTIATNRRFQPKGASEPTEVTAFFSVVAWGQLAENACESFRKGDRVTVSGRVDQRTWTDENGQTHSAFDVVADDLAASIRFRPVKIDRPRREDSPGPFPMEADLPDVGALSVAVGEGEPIELMDGSVGVDELDHEDLVSAA